MTITMTMDEKFERHVWLVLQKINEQLNYTKKGQPVDYWVRGDLLKDSDIPAIHEIQVLEKIEEMGAIRILNPGGTDEYA